MVTIVDDHTRATWTFLISRKSQTLSILTKFIKMVAVELNSTTLLSNPFLHTTKQNGVVERKHKHLQITRALLFQSSLPKFFWDHALLLATFLINHISSSILDWKNPYKILYNKPHDYSVLLRCFGSLCYATNIQPHKDRFSPWASKCIFLGFQHGFKAYKLYDLHTHVVFFS